LNEEALEREAWLGCYLDIERLLFDRANDPFYGV